MPSQRSKSCILFATHAIQIFLESKYSITSCILPDPDIFAFHNYVLEPLAVPGPPTRATRTLKQDLPSSRTKSSTGTKINHHVQPHLQRKIIAHVGDEVEGHGHERPPQQAHSELRNASPAVSPAELDEVGSGSFPAVRLVPDEGGAGKQLRDTTTRAENHENNHPRRRGTIDRISTPDSSCCTTALPETDDVTTDIPSGETFCTGSTTSTSQSSTPIPTRQEASELENQGMTRVVVSTTSVQMNEKKSEDDVLDPAMAIESELLRWIAFCEEHYQMQRCLGLEGSATCDAVRGFVQKDLYCMTSKSSRVCAPRRREHSISRAEKGSRSTLKICDARSCITSIMGHAIFIGVRWCLRAASRLSPTKIEFAENGSRVHFALRAQASCHTTMQKMHETQTYLQWINYRRPLHPQLWSTRRRGTEMRTR